MKKKNTLLYLDQELVRTAKQYGVNISKVTEDAIKSSLFPVLSYGQRIEIDFEGYIKSLEGEKRAFFLPFKVNTLMLSNIGLHKNLLVNFNKLNIIIGKNGSGKTFLIRSIAYAMGLTNLNAESIIKNGKKRGEIRIGIVEENYLSINIERGKELKRKYKCLLLDDPFGKLDKETIKICLDYLKKKGIQIITTSVREIEDKSFKIIRI